ncbi:MAG: protein-export chaperone SecB [Eubacteriaceae bacterium]|nr:protein-export chaperone SecB [Eubacteriaceae bacterium]
MDELKEIESVLTLESLIVEEISFKRDPALANITDMIKSKIGFCREIEYIGDDEDEAKVSLSMSMKHKTGAVELFIKMSGYFQIQSNVDIDLKKELFERNAVAIIFPYLRGQLSILTAQPGFTPVVLPAINIVNLLEKDNDEF